MNTRNRHSKGPWWGALPVLNGLRGIWESPIRMSLALMMNIINSGFVWGSASLSGFVCFKHAPLYLALCVRTILYTSFMCAIWTSMLSSACHSISCMLQFSESRCAVKKKKSHLFTDCQRMLHQPWASWNNETINILLFDRRPIMWRCHSGPVYSAVCSGVKDPVCTVVLSFDS